MRQFGWLPNSCETGLLVRQIEANHIRIAWGNPSKCHWFSLRTKIFLANIFWFDFLLSKASSGRPQFLYTLISYPKFGKLTGRKAQMQRNSCCYSISRNLFFMVGFSSIAFTDFGSIYVGRIVVYPIKPEDQKLRLAKHSSTIGILKCTKVKLRVN